MAFFVAGDAVAARGNLGPPAAPTQAVDQTPPQPWKFSQRSLQPKVGGVPKEAPAEPAAKRPAVGQVSPNPCQDVRLTEGAQGGWSGSGGAASAAPPCPPPRQAVGAAGVLEASAVVGGGPGSAAAVPDARKGSGRPVAATGGGVGQGEGAEWQPVAGLYAVDQEEGSGSSGKDVEMAPADPTAARPETQQGVGKGTRGPASAKAPAPAFYVKSSPARPPAAPGGKGR